MPRVAPCLLPLLLSGCVFLYAPTSAPPGASIPTTEEGAWETTVGMGAYRSTAHGVGMDPSSGDLEADPAAPPIWPGLDLAWRTHLADGLGLDLRWTWSWVLPIPPIPIPNGFTVAPAIRLSESDRLRTHISPRFIRSAGQFTVVMEDEDTMRIRSNGLEIPFTATLFAGRHVAVGSTVYGRGYLVTAKTERIGDTGTITHRASWVTGGGGTTVNLLFTLGHFRIGLGGGVEITDNPGARFTPCEGCAEPSSLLVFPQFGVTIGAARVILPDEVPREPELVPEVPEPAPEAPR